jgi:YesN/AraC family two-component response regulator
MLKVLLVEDEAKIRDGLAAMIEAVSGGFSVAGQTSDGKEALSWLKTNSVDIVITDIRMGEMNGLELLARLRQLFPKLPVIVVSGYSDFEYAKEAIRHGVVDYLLKPVNRVELASVLRRVREQRDEGAAAPDPEGEKTKWAIRRAKEIIRDSLGGEISLQLLADQLFLHPKYLSIIFKKETGQNLSDYVTDCRIKKAKLLLSETNLKVLEIAQMCGFGNYKYFMTVFKQKAGVTPSEFRNE